MKQYPSINEMFAEVTQQYASQPAFSCLGCTLSFADVDRLSRQFAAYLQHHTTLTPGDRLAVQLPNVLQYPIVLFGAIRAGIIVVNTNPLYTGRELIHQLNDSGAKALVVLANLAKAAEEVIDETGVQQVILTEVGDLHSFPKRQLINSVLRYVKKEVPDCHFHAAVNFLDALRLGERDELIPFDSQPDDIAFLQYTGGTTGVAKGAMLTQRNLLANRHQILVAWESSLLPGKEIFLAPLPLYHIYAFTIHCMALFSIGCQSVLIPNPRDIKGLVKSIKSQSPPLTAIVGLNTLFIALMNNEDFKKLDFSNLKITTAGGMALTEDAATHWQQVTGVLPAEGYGLTETSPIVSANVPDDVRLGTVGKAMPETTVKVIDKEGNSLPAGEAGELCVHGPQVMKGYWQAEEATANILSEDGWLKTGDIATIDEDGYIRIVDREKDVVIVSGFNVYPNEVENVLVSHPQIDEAAVIGVEDQNSGEAVKAFLVIKDDNEIDESELKAFCREQLTAYKIPRFFEFRDSLPKTNVGKVLRRELRPETSTS